MASSKPTTTPPSAATATSATKEHRLRQWAAKIVADLPSDADDARRVLELAEQLRIDWLGESKETVQ
jgi:hypothetical protein